MMIFESLTEEHKNQAIKKLIKNSTPDQDFFLLILLSVIMAAFGLLIDNSSVVIGSMLIAPLLSPVLSLSMGVVMADSKLISRAFYTILKSAALAIGFSAIITVFFYSKAEFTTTTLIDQIQPSLVYGAIGLVAGLAASFALVKPDLNESLPGVAISVTLIPPLSAIGIGIARLNWLIINNALIVFVINVIGIIFASLIIFSLMNLYVKKHVAEQAIAREETISKAMKASYEKKKEQANDE